MLGQPRTFSYIPWQSQVKQGEGSTMHQGPIMSLAGTTYETLFECQQSATLIPQRFSLPEQWYLRDTTRLQVTPGCKASTYTAVKHMMQFLAQTAWPPEGEATLHLPLLC